MTEFTVPKVFAPLWKDKASYRGTFGGRGSGKSHNFATMMVIRASKQKGFRAICVREVQRSLKESALRLISDTIERLGLGSEFDVQSTQIKTPGNGLITFSGMQDHTAESIKSLENINVAWAEESSNLSSRSLELLRPTIRDPGSEIWFSWNPRNASDAVDQFLRGEVVPENAVVVKVNYNDNQFFPSELEEERLFDEKHNVERYAHIWLGEYEPRIIGAIFDRTTIHSNRRLDPPKMTRIVVAIDPAISEGGDEHGIIVCGIGEDQRGYVLDDVSRHGSPKQWAEQAIAVYDHWEADAIVIEVNQGGDMVKHTLESVRPGCRILEVRATRGKHVRAEPISALYQLDRISHCGTFTKLENQLCQMTAAGYQGDDNSPDRVDALVWGFTELFPKMNRQKPRVDHRDQTAGSWMA